jgi:alpha-L-fucosidase 2
LYPAAEGWDAELLEAATRSLDVRGNDSTGWSLVWKACLRARLRQPAVVEELLGLLFREPNDGVEEWAGALYPNLFQSNPPFQIDANFGYVAALAECIVQSHDGVIALLPSVPDVLGTGWAHGLVARPGVELDLAWQDGRLTSAVVRASRNTQVTVEHEQNRISLTLIAGVPQPIDLSQLYTAAGGAR